MAKVVTYLFDSMFQGKNKISYAEKALVVFVALALVTTALVIVI